MRVQWLGTEAFGIEVPEQQPGRVVPALDHEGRLVLGAIAPREAALADEALHGEAVVGGALRVAELDVQGIVLDAEKAVEIPEAARDRLRHHLVEFAAEQPHPIVGQVHRIVDFVRPMRGVDQLPGVLGARGTGTEPPEATAEVVRAGNHRRGGAVQPPERPERVVDDVDAAVGPTGEDGGAGHGLCEGDVELVGEEAAGRQARDRH
jgi:hypothetical protein